MVDFSASLASKGLPTSITSPKDIDTLMASFGESLKDLHLWQYYVLDVARERVAVKAALSENVLPWDGPDVTGKSVVELAQILRSTGKMQGLGLLAGRFNVMVDGGVAAGLVKAAFVNVEDNDALAEAWARVVDVLNVPLYEEWKADTSAALDQIRNRLVYIRLDESGPKMGNIDKR
jgi:glycogen debranching enzyme